MPGRSSRFFDGRRHERPLARDVSLEQTAASWLESNRSLLPAGGRALDLACGRGRHARWLAEHGFDVVGIDRREDALQQLKEDAGHLGLRIHAVAADIEQPSYSLGEDEYDAVVVVHYLHRPLFPRILRAIRPGGVLVYETFTHAQRALGRPSNPAFLLEPGELLRLVAPFDVLAAREGFFDGRHVASVVARRPLTTG